MQSCLHSFFFFFQWRSTLLSSPWITRIQYLFFITLMRGLGLWRAEPLCILSHSSLFGLVQLDETIRLKVCSSVNYVKTCIPVQSSTFQLKPNIKENSQHLIVFTNPCGSRLAYHKFSKNLHFPKNYPISFFFLIS